MSNVLKRLRNPERLWNQKDMGPNVMIDAADHIEALEAKLIAVLSEVDSWVVGDEDYPYEYMCDMAHGYRESIRAILLEDNEE